MDLLRAIFIGPLAQMIAAPDLLAQTIWEGFVAGVLYSLRGVIGSATFPHRIGQRLQSRRGHPIRMRRDGAVRQLDLRGRFGISDTIYSLDTLGALRAKLHLPGHGPLSTEPARDIERALVTCR